MMNKYFNLYLLVIILVSSCTEITDLPELFSESKSDTSGYYEAMDLDGLGSFKIGKSTYQQTLSDLKDEWRNDERYHYFNYGSGFGENFSGLREIKYDSLGKGQYDSIFPLRYLACNDVKIIGCYSYYLYDIEISDLALTFYKDTLIMIDCSQNDKIDENFRMNYGPGKVVRETFWFTPNGKTNKKPDKKLLDSGHADILSNFRETTWENHKVKAISYYRLKYKYENRRLTGIDYTIADFSISLKDESRTGEMIKCDSINRLKAANAKR